MNISIINDILINDDKSGNLSSVSSVENCIFSNIGNIACRNHICLGTFLNNKRKKEFFLGIEVISYDFDEGTISSKAVFELLKNRFTLTILASKNHLKDKGDGRGIIERFHLLLPLSEVVRDTELFKYISTKFAEQNGILEHIDSHCKDVTRYYFKHKEILYNSIRNTVNVSYFRNGRSVENLIKEKRYSSYQAEEECSNYNNADESLFKEFLDKYGYSIGTEYCRVKEHSNKANTDARFIYGPNIGWQAKVPYYMCFHTSCAELRKDFFSRVLKPQWKEFLYSKSNTLDSIKSS